MDAANLSRIEQGRYSVGLDILSRISEVLGVKVDLV
ncbi:helix-turn-helix domain-containing protein [Muricauda sp. TY007]|nr:helix-turn-helix domain-containing protein [Muricauda sp. TY007]